MNKNPNSRYVDRLDGAYGIADIERHKIVRILTSAYHRKMDIAPIGFEATHDGIAV